MFIKDYLKISACSAMLMVLLTAPPGQAAAADFSLEALDGQWHQFSEYIGKGKWTVVNIWGTRCPPCQEEMPELVMFHDENSKINASVLGIAIDFPSYRYANKKQVTQFIDDYLVSFPILLADSTVTEKMSAGTLQGLPSTYMYNPKGKLVGYQVGSITKTIIEEFIKRYETRNKSKDIK